QRGANALLQLLRADALICGDADPVELAHVRGQELRLVERQDRQAGAPERADRPILGQPDDAVMAFAAVARDPDAVAARELVAIGRELVDRDLVRRLRRAAGGVVERADLR